MSRKLAAHHLLGFVIGCFCAGMMVLEGGAFRGAWFFVPACCVASSNVRPENEIGGIFISHYLNGT